MIYLVPQEQARQILDVPQEFYAEAWINNNPDFSEYGESAWATPEAIDGLRALGVQPTLLREHEDLPVFHSLGSLIDTSGYEEALTAQILASARGSEVRGVSYVGFNCGVEIRHAMACALGKFFFYSRKPGREFLWRLVSDREDAEWCSALWQNDENFRRWLRNLGIGPEEA